MKRPDSKLLMCVICCVALAACGTPGAPMPPALELARPVSDLRAARKGDKVYLAWTVPAQTTDHQTVRHPGPTRVCRRLGTLVADCERPVAEIPASQFPVPSVKSQRSAAAAKVQANYTDTLPQDMQRQNPAGEVFFAMSVLNDSGRSAGLSNQVQVPSAPTLLPPRHFNAEVKSDGVRLSWECPPADREGGQGIEYRLRVYRLGPNRGDSERQSPTRIGDVNLTECGQSQFLDQTFEWEQHYDYFAAAVTVISSTGKPEVEVEGDDTATIQVFAHDIFPPAVPTGLQAVFSGTGQAAFVDLVWTPDSEADLAGYNIFRHESGGQPVKLNSEAVKTPAYRDTAVQSGKEYFYSVTALDERDNESPKSEEASEQVP